MPSEKPPTRRPAKASMPTSASTASARAIGSPAAVAAIRRWSMARRPGWKPDASSTAPTRLMGSASATYGEPRIVAAPWDGDTRPSRHRNVVVLPAPFGPRKPATLPASTSKERSSTARTGPKRLVSRSMLITATSAHLRPSGVGP